MARNRKKRKPPHRPASAKSQAKSQVKSQARSQGEGPGASAKAEARAPARSPLDTALLALAGAGVALTAYLTWVAWFGEHPLACREGSDCDLVQSSRWSTLLGMPMAFWGLLTYLVLLRLAWILPRRASAWRIAFLVALVGFGISVYLTAISVLVIEAVCPWCLASFGLITAIVAILALRRGRTPSAPAWRGALPGSALAAAVIVAVMHLHFSGAFHPAAGPEQPRLRALAEHLERTGAKFYGAYWCPRCEEQKALFEASMDRLPYIECSPDGRQGAPNVACTIKQIRDYPTWIIGNRRLPGVQSLRTLEQISGFEWPAPTASAAPDSSG